MIIADNSFWLKNSIYVVILEPVTIFRIG